ncbi:hypothetical protein [Clostridium tertium]|uniref:hypothetical protein n=1 Tax=Clostridium tertium TaxID=1559 RepID=UPI001AE9F139|nr:hypothetical protein [Clostridium tertium]MBP1867164.1 hypothetical protein [Clostridium tertium]
MKKLIKEILTFVSFCNGKRRQGIIHYNIQKQKLEKYVEDLFLQFVIELEKKDGIELRIYLLMVQNPSEC